MFSLLISCLYYLFLDVITEIRFILKIRTFQIFDFALWDWRIAGIINGNGSSNISIRINLVLVLIMEQYSPLVCGSNHHNPDHTHLATCAPTVLSAAYNLYCINSEPNWFINSYKDIQYPKLVPKSWKFCGVCFSSTN